MSHAPIALFVYKRPVHTRNMIESLMKNPEFADSPVTVYCDGPKNNGESESIREVRKIVHEMLPNSRIVARDSNIGLATSIINGVGEQCEQYGRAIIFEDDLILSPSVLHYFNKALDYYASNTNVMHIAAYMHPVQRTLPSSFFYREASCWGWATWKRAWDKFEPDAKVMMDYIKRNDLKDEFNIRNTTDFWGMLKAQYKGRLDSWAIRWYASMFMHRGLALHPGRSLSQNKGFDKSGVHCDESSDYDVELHDLVPVLTDEIVESEEALAAIISLRGPLPARFKSLFRKIVNLIK